MRWLWALMAPALAACAVPSKPVYDNAFWRDLADTLEQQERTKP